jgi:hypothetical protein
LPPLQDLRLAGRIYFPWTVADDFLQALSPDDLAREMRGTGVERFGGGLSDSLTTRPEISRRMSTDDYRLVLAKRKTARRAHVLIA